MRVGIIGVGVVGNALREMIRRIHKLTLYDKYKFEFCSDPINRLKDSSVIFICVNTPMKRSGAIDLSAINESVELIRKTVTKENPKTIVIKSTAVSGTTEQLDKKYGAPGLLDFCFNPEFLTANNAIEDFKHASRIILGTNSDNAFNLVKQLYKYA